MKNFILKILITTAFLFITTAQSTEIRKTITLVGSKSTKNSFYGKWLTLIYTDAFKRLGYTLVYDAYPAKRASLLSDYGKVDGEITRVYNYNKKHPNLIRIEESHYTASFVAFGIKPDIKIEGWKSLKEGDYKIGNRMGVKKTETRLKELNIDQNKLIQSHTTLQGLKQALLGRSDIYLDVLQNINDVFKENTFLRESKLKNLGTMESITAHAFLHKKNKLLVPKLNAILKQMKKEGTIIKYKHIAEKL